jgi:hypothetical protein
LAQRQAFLGRRAHLCDDYRLHGPDTQRTTSTPLPDALSTTKNVADPGSELTDVSEGIPPTIPPAT